MKATGRQFPRGAGNCATSHNRPAGEHGQDTPEPGPGQARRRRYASTCTSFFPWKVTTSKWSISFGLKAAAPPM
jgi:hypothetical protein